MPLSRFFEPLIVEAFQQPPFGAGTPSRLSAAAISRAVKPAIVSEYPANDLCLGLDDLTLPANEVAFRVGGAHDAIAAA
jgi:hypothetical protein